MESTEVRGLHVDTSSTVEGGVQDAYGEDRATEDQLVTPWIVSIARIGIILHTGKDYLNKQWILLF
jgi:hypothetical protein